MTAVDYRTQTTLITGASSGLGNEFAELASAATSPWPPEQPERFRMTDDRTTPPRTTAGIPTASGDDIEAWVYLPAGEGPHPAVDMAHGIGAVKAGGLQPFAENSSRRRMVLTVTSVARPRTNAFWSVTWRSNLIR